MAGESECVLLLRAGSLSVSFCSSTTMVGPQVIRKSTREKKHVDRTTSLRSANVNQTAKAVKLKVFV